MEASGGADPESPLPPDAPSPPVDLPIPAESPPATQTNPPSSLEPTLKPTARPTTSAPTSRPTLEPTTDTPTKRPVMSTLEPSTAAPSAKPTDPPSARPTDAPTLDPTQSPSESEPPSRPPTSRPSLSASPSSRPSLAPSATRSPSASPSNSTAPTSDDRYGRLKITLSGIRSIEDVSDWEDATAGYYERVYNGDGSDSIVDATVQISLTNINTVSGGRRAEQTRITDERMTRRALQRDSPDGEPSSVVVTYAQTTTYRSRDPSVGMNELLKLPLSTKEYQQAYVLELKTLEGYEELITVSSISSPYDPPKAIDGTNEAGGLSTGQIIGIACGGAAFLLFVIAGLLYYSRRKGRGGEDANGHSCYGEVAEVADDGEVRIISAAEKSHDPPMGSPSSGGQMTLGDMSVASDFGAGNDGAEEELLTVYAPSGKLGIILDSPDNGPSVIHAVKDGSPIADKVQVGDRLVAVDGEDVRAMTAVGVSKLISRKSSNSRKFTLVRYLS